MFCVTLEVKNAAPDTGSSCQTLVLKLVLNHPSLILILSCSGALLCSGLRRDSSQRFVLAREGN